MSDGDRADTGPWPWRRVELRVGRPRGWGKVMEAVAKEAGCSVSTLRRQVAKMGGFPKQPPETRWGVMRQKRGVDPRLGFGRLRSVYFDTPGEAEAEKADCERVEPGRNFEVVIVTIRWD